MKLVTTFKTSEIARIHLVVCLVALIPIDNAFYYTFLRARSASLVPRIYYYEISKIVSKFLGIEKIEKIQKFLGIHSNY